MNVFKKKSVYLAVAAGLGSVGVMGAASAVNVNPNGLGEVLIYPYYTVNGSTDTYLSVVNTTNSAKAVKVRFTEGKNSREVLDFNLYLSPGDVWTGAVVADATTGNPKLVTSDKSCTSPAIPAAGQSFVNYAYSGAVSEGIVDNGGDGEIQTLDRAKEGYFEIIEMGVITNAAVAAAVTHTSAGVPADCAMVQSVAMDMSATLGGANAVAAPSGGLAGTATLMNVANGTDAGYNPVALASFSDLNIWAIPGSIKPDLQNVSPATSVVYKAGGVVSSSWTNATADAVSAVLMHNTLVNEFVLDTATASGTDFVVTMPTKRYYVPVSVAGATANAPFTKSFYTGGACEPVTISLRDREEGPYDTPATVDFSPRPIGVTVSGPTLCWESNVVTFNNSNLLSSANSSNVSTTFQNGWATIDMSAGHSMTSVNGDVYVGLPVTGFAVQSFKNGNVGGVLSNYVGNFDHKGTTSINGSTAD